jgi:predicted metal-dependent peptidase
MPAAFAPPENLRRQAELAMRRARAALVLDHPFFGVLALRLRLREDAACRDLWTDGTALAYNPAFAATIPEQTLVGAQAHEVLHLAFGHHLRRQGRDKDLWNRACDLAVNQILLEAGFSLPQGFLHDAAYAGLAAEEIYAALMGQREDPTPGEQQSRAGARPGARKDARGSKGGGQSGFTGEVRDHPGVEQEESAALKEAAREAQAALNQALRRARHMGDLPAGLRRQLTGAARPRLDWRALLQRFLEQCAHSDYAWTTPNRRYLFQDIYLPSRREARLPLAALAVDCSASVDATALQRFMAELTAVLDAYDATLAVLFHDSRVHALELRSRMDRDVPFTPVGGGGTDYRPVPARLEAEGLAPACLIWFTDLQCSRFPPPPPYPVLWVCSDAAAEPPPFGTLLMLPEEG